MVVIRRHWARCAYPRCRMISRVFRVSLLRRWRHGSWSWFAVRSGTAATRPGAEEFPSSSVWPSLYWPWLQDLIPDAVWILQDLSDPRCGRTTGRTTGSTGSDRALARYWAVWTISCTLRWCQRTKRGTETRGQIQQTVKQTQWSKVIIKQNTSRLNSGFSRI